MWRWMVLGTVCAALAGCAGDGQSVATTAVGASAVGASRPPTPGFRCPPIGTQVEYSSGTSVAWRGTDPSDTDTCIATVTTATGATEQKRVLNYWLVPQPGLAEVRAGLARLFPLAEGRSATFDRPSMDARSTPITYRESWRVLRRERLTVANQTRDTWVVLRVSEFDGFGTGAFRGELTMWIDAETGVLLKQSVHHARGTWRGMNSLEATNFRPI